jgi:hypothetical protein
VTDFQQIVEECLTRLANGTSNVEECLARYPEHAKQLRPLLRTVYFLNVGPNSKAFPAFQSPNRPAITEYLQKRPQQPRRMLAFPRLAFTVAMLVMALLVTTTAQAQSAIPGDNLYDWKRTSERVWRAVSVDVVATDIALANRRINELRAVAHDSQLSADAMEGYLEVLTRLEAINDTESLALIVPVVQSHQQTLSEVSGVANSNMSNYLVDEIETFSSQAAAIVASASVSEVLPTATRIPPTATRVPPTSTKIPPTATEIPPTATEVPPTATEVPPTATQVPPTATVVPPTATEVPPTATQVPPTVTEVPPTQIPPTQIPPTSVPPTPVPTEAETPAPTENPLLDGEAD